VGLRPQVAVWRGLVKNFLLQAEQGHLCPAAAGAGKSLVCPLSGSLPGFFPPLGGVFVNLHFASFLFVN
jgi:hypothetical protein